MEMNRRFENDDVVVRCWLNSTLVMLFTGSCTQRFWNEVQQQLSLDLQACTPQQHLLQAVVGVFAQMRHQQNGPISAAPVEEALCQLHPQIFKVYGKYHQQQDAAEAWTLLTNNLQKAFLQSNNPERAARLEQMYAYTLAPAVGCLQLDCDAMEVEEDKEQKMVMLHVPTLLPDGRLVHRLMDGIEAELREHSHNPFCHYIEGKMMSWKGKAMRELPPMLIVQLKRFDFKGMSSKLHHAVEYPHLLDLKAVCEDSLKQLGETRFQLEGVLLHEGDGTEWGHYSGEYQTPDGAWQHISDADMSHSSLQSALSHQTEVYMAVYKRLSSRSPVQQAQPCRSSAGETIEERAINERKAARSEQEHAQAPLHPGCGCARQLKPVNKSQGFHNAEPTATAVPSPQTQKATELQEAEVDSPDLSVSPCPSSDKARQGSLLKGSTAASPRRQPNRKGKQLLQPKKLLIAAAAVMLGRMLQQHYKRK